MTDAERIEDLRRRYRAACHAMQSGVAFTVERDPADTTPKHLRVGVNSAMVETSVLAHLLIGRGIFSTEDHLMALVEAMEAEVKLYEARIKQVTGAAITLG